MSDTWTSRRFLEALREQYDVATDGSAVERIQLILRRLQRDVPVAERCDAAIVAMPNPNAFVVPGYVFITRKLLDRCTEDAMLAMLLGHELAHLQLGHHKARSRWARRFAQLVSGTPEQYSHEMEFAADRRGLELCIAAGYDPLRCIELGTALQHAILDHGQHGGVFGSGRGSTHPGLKLRQKALRDYLATLTGNYPESAQSQRCTHCDQEVAHLCARCDEPLCHDHGTVRQARCVKCEAAPYPLCRVCKRTRQCLKCDTSLWCRYCASAATRACPTCERAFCDEHARHLDPQCGACVEDELDELRAKRKRRIVRMAKVGGALIAVALVMLRRR